MKKILLNLALVATVQLNADLKVTKEVNVENKGIQLVEAELLKGFYLERTFNIENRQFRTDVILSTHNCLITAVATQLRDSNIVNVDFDNMTCDKNGELSYYKISGYITDANYKGIKGYFVNQKMSKQDKLKNKHTPIEHQVFLKVDSKKHLISVINYLQKQP